LHPSSAPEIRFPQRGFVMDVAEYFLENYIELTGFLFGVIYVILVIREHYLCWVAGSINVVIYIVVFFHNNLYGMSLLQVFYLIMSVYGFLLWRGVLETKGKRNSGQVISNMPWKTWLFIMILLMLTVLLTGYLLSFTDSEIPWLDSLITMMGLAATWMTARKYIESWWVWIVNDLICVFVYLYLELYLTAALYAVFFVMAIVGYFAWRKRMQTENR
jgi:nicotinamide mononucleotide transporter